MNVKYTRLCYNPVYARLYTIHASQPQSAIPHGVKARHQNLHTSFTQHLQQIILSTSSNLFSYHCLHTTRQLYIFNTQSSSFLFINDTIYRRIVSDLPGIAHESADEVSPCDVVHGILLGGDCPRNHLSVQMLGQHVQQTETITTQCRHRSVEEMLVKMLGQYVKQTANSDADRVWESVCHRDTTPSSDHCTQIIIVLWTYSRGDFILLLLSWSWRHLTTITMIPIMVVASAALTWTRLGRARRGTSCRSVSWRHEQESQPCPDRRTVGGPLGPSSGARL